MISVIQVCLEVHHDNKEREVNGLLEAMNEFNLKEGTIVTLDQSDRLKIDGKEVKLVPVADWINENELQ